MAQSVSTLMTASECFACLSEKDLLMMLAYLSCQWVG